MKKLILILLCLPLLFSTCKKEEDEESIYTYIPDNNFEIALINLGLDNTLNDMVLTAAIDTLTYLSIDNINDVTGIEKFTSLTYLMFSNCTMKHLELRKNTSLTELYCLSSSFTSLDVSQNTSLSVFGCNQNQLTSLDVSNNTALTRLICGDNQLTSLDVSNNIALTYLECRDNLLTNLDLRNGNNTNLYINATDNIFLYCIDVDNEIWSNTSAWGIPSQSFFSEECGVK